LVAAQQRWSAVAADIDGFETRLLLAAWGLELRVVVYRKRVHHQSAKNYQLDLFSPDDGYFEYSAVATNLTLTPRALWYFAPPAAVLRKRPSPNSRASLPSTQCPPITMAPTAPGSSCASSLIT